MEALKFTDSHNMVAYLDKSMKNANFDEIVDFLNANPIRYSLTVSPTIYVSYIEQFWSTTKTKIVNNETQIHAKVDGKTIVITKSSVRRDLHFNDEDDETVHKERGDSVEKVTTTTTSLDAEHGSGNINRTQSTAIPNDPFPQGTGSGGSPKRQDTILGIRPAQTRFKRVLSLENIKTSQDLEITNPKKRVKKLENKTKSRTPQLKRRNEIDQEEGISCFQEDAETQGRYGHDTEINTVSTSITNASINITTTEPVITASAPVATAGVSVSTVEPSTAPPTTTFIEDEDLTIAQTFMKMRSMKTKEKSKEKGVSSETATRLTRGVIMKEASETATIPTVPPQQQLNPKDKGKGIMQEPEKPVKVKGKDQIEYDADVAQRVQAELDKEVRLEREREEEASNAALIK
ncbi:hypothetical protein Tco_1210360 [Tanacetum coccineum]